MEEDKKSENKTSVDHGLDSPKAQYYNHVKKMEQAFLRGESLAEPEEAPVEEVQPAAPAPTVPAAPADAVSTVITFVPKKIPIEFSFNVSDEKALKVKVIALQVGETDEALTVLLDKTVEFTFPVLLPFFVKLQDGTVHKVCYAGGTCQIGACKFVSFIKTT